MLSIEREELEAEQRAREDYMHEAYGHEADMLAAQGRDEMAADAGFSSWHVMQDAYREDARRRRASNSIRQGHEDRDPANDVPF